MSRSSHVIPLPKWVLFVRGFQLLLAVIVMGVSAYGIYWVAFNSWCFALFTALATMIIVLYAILTNHVAACAGGYNYWALLALEIFGVLFWLSSMAALAATRAAFVFPTEINGCVNYGYGGVCYKKRDIIEKRAVATYGYLDMMSATAGLSAIEMLLFITTLTVFSIHLRRTRSSNKHAPINDKLEAHPMNPVAYEQSQQYSAPHQYGAPQYNQQQPYDPPQQTYPQQPAPQPYQGIEVNQAPYAPVSGQHY